MSEIVTSAPVELFAAVREASATPLLGTEDDTLLAAGGTLMAYGEGGAGKTTAELDLAFHLAAGIAWLGQPVPARVRGLILEAEGPRGKFRKKLDTKLAAWKGPTLDGWLHVIDNPWATLSLADPEHRAMIADQIRTTGAEVLFAGPVAALGLEGGGTPAEVRQFVAHLEHIRALVGRDVAFVLIAHTNKGGQVSGAWEGATDTLAHFMATGNGQTRLHWKKCRWAGELHGAVWNLHWRQGETFELEEKPVVTADTIEADLLAAITANPGASWATIRARITGNATESAKVRDRLLTLGLIVNTATRQGYFNLTLPDDPTLTRSEAGTTLEQHLFLPPERGHGDEPFHRSSLIGNGERNGTVEPGLEHLEQGAAA